MLMRLGMYRFFKLTIQQLTAVRPEQYPPRSVPILRTLVSVLGDGIAQAQRYENRPDLMAWFTMRAEVVRICFPVAMNCFYMCSDSPV